jgi:excisionase family DNA binding protein
MHNSLETGIPDEPIMTLGEVADYLKVGEKSVLRMVRRGELPAAKVASQWRFVRAMVDDWLMARMQTASPAALLAVIGQQGVVPLARLLSEPFIRLDLVPGTKRAILEQLVAPLGEHSIVSDAAGFVGGLLDREELVSTAVGSGIALPHLRNPEDCPPGAARLVFGHCRQGTDFCALDGAPTRLFFLLCIADEAVHLMVLARLALILRDSNVVARLLAAASPREVEALLREKDQERHIPKETP